VIDICYIFLQTLATENSSQVVPVATVIFRSISTSRHFDIKMEHDNYNRTITTHIMCLHKMHCILKLSFKTMPETD